MESLFTVNEVKLSYRQKQKASERPKVLDSYSVYKILFSCFDKETIDYRESCKILLLNRSNQVLGVFNVSEGGVCSTVVDIRLIMQSAILSHANGIILAHNHPSGNIFPSKDDDLITNRIKDACRLMDIRFLDHIIITSDTYYSYSDEGRI